MAKQKLLSIVEATHLTVTHPTGLKRTGRYIGALLLVCNHFKSQLATHLHFMREYESTEDDSTEDDSIRTTRTIGSASGLRRHHTISSVQSKYVHAPGPLYKCLLQASTLNLRTHVVMVQVCHDAQRWRHEVLSCERRPR